MPGAPVPAATAWLITRDGAASTGVGMSAPDMLAALSAWLPPAMMVVGVAVLGALAVLMLRSPRGSLKAAAKPEPGHADIERSAAMMLRDLESGRERAGITLEQLMTWSARLEAQIAEARATLQELRQVNATAALPERPCATAGISKMCEVDSGFTTDATGTLSEAGEGYSGQGVARLVTQHLAAPAHGVENLAAEPRADHDDEPRAADFDNLALAVHRLADEGCSSTAIARRLNAHAGTVELILALRAAPRSEGLRGREARRAT